MDVDRRGHLIELQSIRGIAALTVFMGHLAGIYGGPAWWMRLVPVLNGRAAVGTFFVLSGYVLTRMLYKRELNLRSYLDFGVRRVFRIYPVLIAASTAALLFTLIYRFAHLNVPNVWFQNYFTETRQSPILLVLCFLGLSAHLLPQAWTITVELAGSALMFFIVWLAVWRRGRTALVWALPLLLLVAVTVGPHTPYSILMYVPHFIVGSLIFVLPEKARVQISRLPGKAAIVVAAAIILLAFRSFFQVPFNNPAMAMVELAAASLIIALVTAGGANLPILRVAFLEWLGDVSYSLYLIHFPVIFTVVATLLLGERALGVSIPPIAAALITAITCLAIVLPLSALSYKFIELPGNEIGKRLASRIGRGKPRPAAGVQTAEESALV